jgi:hypothetical protein
VFTKTHHRLPQYVFMAWCLVKHRDNFTFTFTGQDNDSKITDKFFENINKLI